MQMKRLSAACGIALAGAVATPAVAQVTAIVPESKVELAFKPSDTGPGAPTGDLTVNGLVIAGNYGDTGFGSGASYASTSDVGPGVIYFKNGNASTGQFTRSISTTLVDITFANDGTETVTPRLTSQIIPAGFGMFVGLASCPNDPTACNPVDPLPGSPPRNFNSFAPSGQGPEDPSNVLSSASFTFRIYANDFVAYELTGDMALIYGGGTGPNTIVTNIAQAQSALTDFTQQSPEGSEDFIGFTWGATTINVNFAPGTLLDPGESATLRYETIVETYSRTNCLGGSRSACLVSYGSFGDPVGRAPPGQIGLDNKLAFGSFTLEAAPGTDPTGILFDEFTFQTPVFRNGRLIYVLENTAVPEPGSWAMLIAGFGIVGASMRRRRQLPA